MSPRKQRQYKTKANKLPSKPAPTKKSPRPGQSGAETLELLLQRARMDPNSISRADASRLQRGIGNQAVGQLAAERKRFRGGGDADTAGPSLKRILDHRAQLSDQSVQSSRPIVQAKLTLGPASDSYEREADTAANQVVNQISSPPSQVALHKDGEALQMKPSLRRRAAAGPEGGEIPEELERSVHKARGRGQPLADEVRQPMERAFGADFGGVRVHTDSRSDSLNRSMQARAFTTGQDIFFGGGQYHDGSRAGQELIAHELTHVVQQKGDTIQREIKPTKGGIKDITLNVTFSVTDVECDGLQAVQCWWGTESTVGTKVGKMELKEGKTTYEAFVDGGKNSPYVTLSGKSPAHDSKPYYLTGAEVARQVDYDAEKKSGTIRVYDKPSAVVFFNEFNFETAIVAVNYKGTGKDKILQAFTWGWSKQGTKPTHEEGDEIEGKPSGIKSSGGVSSTFRKIVSNDYPDYSYD